VEGDSVVGSSKELQSSNEKKKTQRHLNILDFGDGKMLYICRVTRDFEICEQEAEQLE